MFYIVSRGSTATHWLAKNLSKHKDLVCFFSSRSFPPVEPGKGNPTNKNTWIKDDLEAENAIIMEKLFTDKNYYKNLILDLAPGTDVSNDYLDEIYSSINNRVNAHREKPINSKQILEDIPDCMTKIYQYYYKTYQIRRLSDAFGYDFK